MKEAKEDASSLIKSERKFCEIIFTLVETSMTNQNNVQALEILTACRIMGQGKLPIDVPTFAKEVTERPNSDYGKRSSMEFTVCPALEYPKLNKLIEQIDSCITAKINKTKELQQVVFYGPEYGIDTFGIGDKCVLNEDKEGIGDIVTKTDEHGILGKLKLYEMFLIMAIKVLTAYLSINGMYRKINFSSTHNFKVA